MPCTSPLIRIEYHKTLYNKSGQPYLASRIIGQKDITDYEHFTKYEEMRTTGTLPDWMRYFETGKNRYLITQVHKIPCGHCMSCRLAHSREWAQRCVAEASVYKNNWFFTLTYDEEHLPQNKTGTGTLRPDDLTKFMKDLRRHWEYHFKKYDIRFFACGEYGETTERPHYHAEIFNLWIPPEEMKPLYITQDHKQIWTCERIEKIWGKGIIAIGECNWNTSAYVARYITKKQIGKDATNYYKDKDCIPEFIRMSRRPGIGFRYFMENETEIYKNDEIIQSNMKGAISQKPCKYYDKLYDLDYPERMEEIKEKRKQMAIETAKVRLSKTTLPEKEYLQVQARTQAQKAKRLKRSAEI